jgi:hypothetical protein
MHNRELGNFLAVNGWLTHSITLKGFGDTLK